MAAQCQPSDIQYSAVSSILPAACLASLRSSKTGIYWPEVDLQLSMLAMFFLYFLCGNPMSNRKTCLELIYTIQLLCHSPFSWMYVH